MSDLMLLGVLRMPMDEYAGDLKLRQFIDRAREAADRIETLEPAKFDLLEALRDAATTLTEAANCLRRSLPSLADNVIEKCAERARAAIAKASP